MTTNALVSPAWPAAPDANAPVADRLAWYAAVARWAPSKHNTQPWRFVVRDDVLEVWEDLDRALPRSDPRHRELVIGCGAALQLAVVAARAIGRQPQVKVLPDGEQGCLARLTEVGPWATTEDDLQLLEAVPARRTDRGPLDAGRLAGSLPFLLQSAAAVEGASFRLVSRAGDRSTLAALVERADRMLAQRGEVDAELSGWVRVEGDARGDDGVPADHTRGPAASYRAEFVQRDFSTVGSTPAHDRPGVDQPVVGVLCTSGDGRLDWLVAGRALAALLLRAEVMGAHASYLNQPVENRATRQELRDQLRLDGQPQLVLRVGAGAEVTATPRRAPEDVTTRR